MIDNLCKLAATFLDKPIQPIDWLKGGHEADVLHVYAGADQLVLYVSPAWRPAEQLRWTHEVAFQAAQCDAPVVTPIVRDGRSFFSAENRLVTVFPFIEGHLLNRDDPAQVIDAARCLGQIHTALTSWQPLPMPVTPTLYPIPNELQDDALDAAWQAALDDGLTIGVTHGDYYRGNLLARDHKVVGIIDWNEAEVRPILLDIAGAVFELCKNDEHELRLSLIPQFLQAYLKANDTLPRDELAHLLTAIRMWVRADILPTLTSNPNAQADEYVAKQIAAFHRLRKVTLPALDQAEH